MALPEHGPPLPVDPIADRLIALYLAAEKKLDGLIAGAAGRGALGTARYFTNQLTRVSSIVKQLQREAAPLKAALVPSAYGTGVAAVDRVLDAETAFSGVHAAAMEVIAANLEGHLRYAEEKIGRNAADVFRRIGLEQAGIAIAAGTAPRQQAADVERELRQEGVTAFVDKRGRRWSLGTYAAMVARTTTREANSVGMKNRLIEHGRDLVEISEHRRSCPICLRYQGKTFSLTGTSGNYPQLDELPPFHPNCRHVLLPARVTFEEMERALGLGPTPAVEQALEIDTEPRAAPGFFIAPQIDRSKVSAIREAQGAIDEVIDTPDGMPTLHLEPGEPDGVASGTFDAGIEQNEETGEYRFLPTIRVRSDASLPTVVHELGHYLDRYAFTAGATDRQPRRLFDDPDATELRDAIMDSPPIRDLFIPIRRPGDMPAGYAEYLTSPTESFARAFSQYVAVKTGREAEFRAYYEGNDPEIARFWAWPAEDFEPIERAFDSYFAKKGWLRSVDGDEAEIGVTPYRGSGTDRDLDYYATSRYKGFERRVREEAAKLGMTIEQFDRSRGVWAGGGEPSATLKVRGQRPGDVEKFMDRIGSAFNQDAVISWRDDPGGPDLKYRSREPVQIDDATIEAAIAEVNEGFKPDEQIQGATRGPDGHLVILDLGRNATAAVRALAAKLELPFGYAAGRGALRFKGDDY